MIINQSVEVDQLNIDGRQRHQHSSIKLLITSISQRNGQDLYFWRDLHLIHETSRSQIFLNHLCHLLLLLGSHQLLLCLSTLLHHLQLWWGWLHHPMTILWSHGIIWASSFSRKHRTLDGILSHSRSRNIPSAKDSFFYMEHLHLQEETGCESSQNETRIGSSWSLTWFSSNWCQTSSLGLTSTPKNPTIWKCI